MKNHIYTPKPGSAQEKMIQALQEGPLLPERLSAAIGVTHGLLKYHIATPLKHGLIVPVKDATQVRHYALGDREFAGFTLDELSDDRVVRHVSEPSVKPSQKAIEEANLFRPRVPLQPEPPRHTPPVPKATHAKKAVSVPAAPTEADIKAGLFSNGELVICKGEEQIRLSPTQTRTLFNYLEKITDLLCETAAEPVTQ